MTMVKEETRTELDTVYWPVSGLPDIPFTIDDLKDGDLYEKEEAWDMLNEGNPYLEMDNFVNKDTFWKYWFSSIGFLDYASVIIYGEKGDGKSLFEAWALDKMATLFGKKLTIDWTPPVEKRDRAGNLVCPEHFRNAYLLFDDDYKTKIRDTMNLLAQYQKRYGKMPPKELLEKLVIYGAAWGFDESQTWADKGHRTNMTRLIAGVDNIARHLHTSIFFTFIKPNRADELIAGLTTHWVSCAKEYDDNDVLVIRYTITAKREKIVKKVLLRPIDWTHIWDTHALTQVSHNFYINLGGRGKDKSSGMSLADFLTQEGVKSEGNNGDN